MENKRAASTSTKLNTKNTPSISSVGNHSRKKTSRYFGKILRVAQKYVLMHIKFAKPYAFAFLITTLAYLLKTTFDPIIAVAEIPSYLLFFGALVASTWYAGLRGGVLSTIYSSILINYFLLPPEHVLSLSEFVTDAELLFFTLEGLAVSSAIAYLKWTREKYIRAKIDLSHQLNDMTKLNELGIRLSTHIELKEVLNEVLDELVEQNQANMGMIRFYNRVENNFYIAATKGVSEEYQKATIKSPFENSPSGRAILQKKAISIEDYQKDPHLSMLQKNTHTINYRSLFCSPLITRSGKILGTVTLYFKKTRKFTEEELNLAENYVRLAAEIIDDALLYKEAETARKRAEKTLETLAQSEARYRGIGESLAYGVWATDGEGKLTYVSDSYLKLLGMTFEGYKNFGWLKKISSDSEKRTFTDWKRCVKTKSIWNYEYKIKGADGNYHAVLARGIPFKDNDNNVIGWAGINLDISASKEAEENLRLLLDSGIELSSSLNLETTLNRMTQIIVPSLADISFIYTLDESGKIHRVTFSFGKNVDEKLIKTITKEQKNPIVFNENHPIAKAIRTQKPQVINKISDEWLKNISHKESLYEIRKKMGWESFMALPMISRNEVIGAVSFISTNPNRKYSTEDLSFAEELTRHAALAVDNAKLFKKAQDAIRSRDEFLSIASHELKTPLTSLLLELENAIHKIIQNPSKNISASGLTKNLENAQWQSKRLSQLINNLLDLSRITFGRLGLEFEEVDLTKLIKNIIDKFEEELEISGYKLEFKASTSPIGTWDRLRIEQIFTNLLTNAMKYGNSKPIEIEVSADNSIAKLTIKDHGMGIAQKDIKNIFSPFERATKTYQSQSLGMGLYITKQIVEAHGGKINVKSKLKEWTVFTIELPLGEKAKFDERKEDSQTPKHKLIKLPPKTDITN